MNQTGLGPDAHGRGCQEMGSHAHERSRTRAARGLAAICIAGWPGERGEGDGEGDEAVKVRPPEPIETVQLSGIKMSYALRRAGRPLTQAEKSQSCGVKRKLCPTQGIFYRGFCVYRHGVKNWHLNVSLFDQQWDLGASQYDCLHTILIYKTVNDLNESLS